MSSGLTSPPLFQLLTLNYFRKKMVLVHLSVMHKTFLQLQNSTGRHFIAISSIDDIKRIYCTMFQSNHIFKHFMILITSGFEYFISRVVEATQPEIRPLPKCHKIFFSQQNLIIFDFPNSVMSILGLTDTF